MKYPHKHFLEQTQHSLKGFNLMSVCCVKVAYFKDLFPVFACFAYIVSGLLLILYFFIFYKLRDESKLDLHFLKEMPLLAKE